MFISNEEKSKILSDLEYVKYQNSLFHSRLNILEKKIAQLEPKPVKAKKQTEEQLKAELKKARQRAYGRAYYQRKKEREQVLNVGS